MTPPPSFSPDTKPAVVLDTTGRWLGAELGFKWFKSVHELRRTGDGRVERLILQPSSWSRADAATWVSPRVMIEDRRLAHWRARHAELSVVPDGPFQARVFNSLTVNISHINSVELTGFDNDTSGAESLGGFLNWLRTEALAAIDAFQTPQDVSDRLPPAWFRMGDAGLVEFALSRAETDVARDLVRRIVGQPLRGLQRRDERIAQVHAGWASPGPPEPTDSFASLGWLSRKHDLLTLGDLDGLEPMD